MKHRVALFAAPPLAFYWKCLEVEIELRVLTLTGSDAFGRTGERLDGSRIREIGFKHSFWVWLFQAHQLEIPSCRIYSGWLLGSAAF